MQELNEMENQIHCIGVLTSGGDAPGMNAAIRAVVRTALSKGYEVRGIRRGYHGLLKEEIIEMNSRDVAGIINRGGTKLLTARSKSMMTIEGQRKAAAILKKYGIDALVVIGGDGTYKGALSLARLGIKVIGIPGTIDMDISSTDYTIGFDTAINTAVEAIDKVQDSSLSHDRCCIIEVMGRNAGYIALWSGIAVGAEQIYVPERAEDFNKEALIADIKSEMQKGKKTYTIVVAEGIGDAMELAEYVEAETGLETRASVLGYMQRGGTPTCKDRMYASRLGSQAVELLSQGKYNRVVATKRAKFVDYDIEEALQMTKEFPRELCDMAKVIR